MKGRFENLLAALALSSMLLLPACSSSGGGDAKKVQPDATADSLSRATAPPEKHEVDEPKKTPSAQEPAPAAKPRTKAAQRPVRSAPLPPEAPKEQASAAPAPVVVPPQPPIPAPVPVPPAPEPQIVPEPAPRQITIPSGTLIAIRMIDSVDSSSDHVGQTFHASLDAPVLVDNQVVVPKSADVYLKLTEVESAGRLKGQSRLKLQLDRIFVEKKSYAVESNVYEAVGAAQGAKTAKTVGIGAAIGAAIGAIAGGKKGAVIGAGTGAGAGVGVEAATKGEQVRVDSETRLNFRLEQPLEVTLQPTLSASPSQARPLSGPARLGNRGREER